MEINFEEIDEIERLKKERDKMYGIRPMSKESVEQAIKRFEKTGSFASPVIDVEIEVRPVPLLLE